MTLEQVIEIIERYKLRIPPTVYYDLLADVQEAEEEQESTNKNNLGVDCISRQDVLSEIIRFSTEEGSSVECQQLYCDVNNMPSVTPQEPILDKITEIIEPLRHLSLDQMSDIEWQILRVIDKYKAETEADNG